jgi:hypothetical protein
MPRQPEWSRATPTGAVEGELLTDEDRSDVQVWMDKRQLARVLSQWSDTVFEIPGLGWRFGLDPLIGLIPVAGDLATAVLSLYILALAAESRVPRSTLLRMGLNVAIDYVLGAVPLLGNIFDFAWKANHRNMQLLERSLATPADQRRKQSIWDWALLVGVIVGLASLFIASLVVALLIAGWIISLFTQSPVAR